MSRRKVPLLTFKSLTSLSKSKVRSSISIHHFSSIAAQRSNFSNSVDYHSDDSNNSFHNSTSNSYAQAQKPNRFVPNPSGNGLNPNQGFTQNNGSYQNSVDTGGNYRGNTGGQFQYDYNEPANWNSNNFHDRSNGAHGTNGNYQGLNRNYGHNVNQWHSGSSSNYMGSVGVSQHHPNFENRQQSVNAGPYWSNSNNVQNVMEVSGVANGAETDGNSGGSPIQGTLQEFDEFCSKKNVAEAVKVLPLLEEKHITVDLSRLLQLIETCGELRALEEAKAVHHYIGRSQPPLDVSASVKIIDTYGKCGDINSSFAVFNQMPERDLASWSTMITWLAKSGLGEDAIDLFSEFKQAGLVPDARMFMGVFSACGTLGDVSEGMLHFQSLQKDYGIAPSMEHFLSIVDMMGTAGFLDEAFEFIEKMPMEPSIDVWETLMNHSRVHGHLELGDRCAELVGLLDPSRLNQQSKSGLVPAKESDLMKNNEKRPGNQNSLEVRSRLHEYRAGDKSHPESDRIYAMLRGLKAQMKEEGYIPETRFVLHDVDQESKEDALLAHSERLAAAYGLLTSPARFPIRVIKNLRVCGDCHNAIKIISKIVGRELIMRDAKRFHHFKNGVCSCRDYW